MSRYLAVTNEEPPRDRPFPSAHRTAPTTPSPPATAAPHAPILLSLHIRIYPTVEKDRHHLWISHIRHCLQRTPVPPALTGVPSVTKTLLPDSQNRKNLPQLPTHSRARLRPHYRANCTDDTKLKYHCGAKYRVPQPVSLKLPLLVDEDVIRG